jgi:RNA polymerase-binding transcription factor DksA
MTKEREKLRYSREELAEFELLINSKLEVSKGELNQHISAIRRSQSGMDDGTRLKNLEDGADSAEREHLNQLAARTEKYVRQLENALIRIKNGTYGICIDTGKLIPKERLRAVPHTQHCIEAKQSKQ